MVSTEWEYHSLFHGHYGCLELLAITEFEGTVNNTHQFPVEIQKILKIKIQNSDIEIKHHIHYWFK